MIKKEELASLFLQLSPDFRPAWEKHLAFWGSEPRGDFNDAAVFADTVVEMYGSSHTEHFPAIFGLIEKFLTEGDEETKGIAVYGYLEDIQTISSHHPHGMDVFVPWLGPESLEAWQHLKEIWAGKGSLMEVIRAEIKNQRE